MNGIENDSRKQIPILAAVSLVAILLAGAIIQTFSDSASASNVESAWQNCRHVLLAANNNATSSDLAKAVQLYNQKAYGPATDAFERLLSTSTPEPNLYYYAALANLGIRQEARAKQLFQYIVTNFPRSVQASYSRTALGSQSPGGQSQSTSPQPAASADVSELPESVKASLPKEMQDMLRTPEGQKAVKEALYQHADKLQAIKSSAVSVTRNGSGPAVSVATLCDNKGPNQIKILFIGNSFTSTYQLPSMFAELCGNTVKLKIAEVICTEASRVTSGGFTLDDHWNSGQAIETIQKDGPWDYVVIQDSSIRPISEPAMSLDSIGRFDAEIRKHGAKTVLYETWANQREPQLQATLNQTYRTAANNTHAILVAAGEAWHSLTENHSEINLYGPDTHHPSPEGVYLTACVFYATLFKKDPGKLGTSAGNIAPAVAAVLQKQAWETARSSP